MAEREPTAELVSGSGPVHGLAASEAQAALDSLAPNDCPQAQIAEALRNNWLEMWYQPKIDLKRKCLAGAEALARIRHPALGVLLPESFLPLADEESVLLLTERVCIAALRAWSTFDTAGFNLHIAINIPASALFQLPIAAMVGENRPMADHWPGLILEVTEGQIVRDITRAHEVATQLRASGITIAIDDFGAGYSSFASLRELPFAELKVDNSFVKNCASDATNAGICQTAIDLAHRFGSVAVAEGIETSADLQALLMMGCDYGQGILIAPPMREDRFIGLLRQHMNKPSQRAGNSSQPTASRTARYVA